MANVGVGHTDMHAFYLSAIDMNRVAKIILKKVKLQYLNIENS